MELKARIKQIREDAGEGMGKFAEALGVARTTVYRWETGDNEPNEIMLRAICRQFKVNYEWLTTGKGETYSTGTADVLELLTDIYKLDELDQTIIKYYLELPEEQKEVFKAFARQMIEKGKKEKESE